MTSGTAMCLLKEPIAVDKIESQGYDHRTSCNEKSASKMNATAKQQKETELQQMYQKIQQTYQDNQQAMQKKSAELMEPIRTKVLNAITEVGKAGGYTYIFEDGVAIFTGATVKDVTADVQAKLK